MESRMMANYQVRFGGRFTGVLLETSRFRPYPIATVQGQQKVGIRLNGDENYYS